MWVAEGSQEILQVDRAWIVRIQRVDAFPAVRRQQFVSGGRRWDESSSDETDFLKL